MTLRLAALVCLLALPLADQRIGGFRFVVPRTQAVATIFSTTFASALCAEWTQSDGLLDANVCQTGDGIAGAGAWTTSNSSEEQITTAANYSSGGGGRGQRHWIGMSHGNTNESGELTITPPGGNRAELYLRWYTRWETGLKLGGDTAPILRAQKLVYWNGQVVIFDIEGSSWSLTINGNDYHSGTGWDGLFGGSNAASDGNWHRIELHVKCETNAAANDGIWEVKVDGTTDVSMTNMDFHSVTALGPFEFPSNHQFTTVLGDAADQYQDLDDLAVSVTGWIGASLMKPEPLWWHASLIQNPFERAWRN